MHNKKQAIDTLRLPTFYERRVLDQRCGRGLPEISRISAVWDTVETLLGRPRAECTHLQCYKAEVTE